MKNWDRCFSNEDAKSRVRTDIIDLKVCPSALAKRGGLPYQ